LRGQRRICGVATFRPQRDGSVLVCGGGNLWREPPGWLEYNRADIGRNRAYVGGCR
jgi:hypothetical protein